MYIISMLPNFPKHFQKKLWNYLRAEKFPSRVSCDNFLNLLTFHRYKQSDRMCPVCTGCAISKYPYIPDRIHTNRVSAGNSARICSHRSRCLWNIQYADYRTRTYDQIGLARNDFSSANLRIYAKERIYFYEQ